MSRLASVLAALALAVTGVVATAPSASASIIRTRPSCKDFAGTVVAKGRLPIKNVGLSRSTYLIKRNAKYRYCVQVHNATPRKGYIVLAYQFQNQCDGDKWESRSKNFGYRSSAAITFFAGFEKNIALTQVVYPATKRTALKRTTVARAGVIGCVG